MILSREKAEFNAKFTAEFTDQNTWGRFLEFIN